MYVCSLSCFYSARVLRRRINFCGPELLKLLLSVELLVNWVFCFVGIGNSNFECLFLLNYRLLGFSSLFGFSGVSFIFHHPKP